VKRRRQPAEIRGGTGSTPNAHARRAETATLRQRFETEVLPLHPLVHRWAIRRTANRTDADDLVQETFIRAFRGFAGLGQGANVRGWMYRIFSNALIDEYRRSRRRPAPLEPGGLEERATAGGLPVDESAEGATLRRLAEDDLRGAFGSLPPPLRTAVWLAAQGFTYREIAEMLAVSVGTVKSRVHRGRVALSRAWTSSERGEELQLTGSVLRLHPSESFSGTYVPGPTC
jgi:RNA polymerase sigma-70 factor (ECF subfamily)